METILAALAPQLIELIGIALAGLATWGIALLKKKTNADVAQTALDHVDRVTSTVVDGLTQTVAQSMKEAAADGKLSAEEISGLKDNAIQQTKALLSNSVMTTAAAVVGDLNAYIAAKIEARVLAQKK